MGVVEKRAKGLPRLRESDDEWRGRKNPDNNAISLVFFHATRADLHLSHSLGLVEYFETAIEKFEVAFGFF